MRISDRSSDVCSSDLWGAEARGTGARHYRPLVVGTSGTREWHAAQGLDVVPAIPCCLVQRCIALQCGALLRAERRENLARKSVVSGKSVSVRVDLGGRRIIKKKKNKNNKRAHN